MRSSGWWRAGCTEGKAYRRAGPCCGPETHGLLKRVGRTYKYYLTDFGRKVAVNMLSGLSGVRKPGGAGGDLGEI